MNWYLYFSFIGASVLILAMPGPSFAYAVAVASRASRREVIGNAVGMALGGLAITLALALGVSHLLNTAPVAYTVLQVTGCAYLLWLGIQALRSSPVASELPTEAPVAKWRFGPLLQGFLVETTNPKAILFYSAMIPQFADPSFGAMQRQLLILGGTFVTMQVLWDVSLMLGIVHFREAIIARRSPRFDRIMKNVCGITFISMALALLLHERPSAP
jgi:threonine/homoserine/homoserine lactone efflux protein